MLRGIHAYTKEHGLARSAWIIEPDHPGDGIAEPAVTLETFSGGFTLQQREGAITLNYEAIPDLIKALREAHKLAR